MSRILVEERGIGSIIELWHILIAIFLSVVALCGCKRCLHSCTKDCNWRDMCCFGALGRNIFGERPDFKLGILVHHVLGMPLRMPLSVRVEVVGEARQTSISKTGKWNEELRVWVRQGAKQLSIVLVDDRKRVFGKTKLFFKKDLQQVWDEEGGGIITEKQVHITAPGSSTAKGVLVMSFSTGSFMGKKEDLLAERGIVTENISGHLGKLLSESHAAGQLDHAGNMSDEERRKQKMMVLAGALKGPVIRIGNFGKRMELFMKAIAGSHGDGPPRWHIGLWESQRAADNQTPPEKVVPILRITAVFSEPSKQDHFVLRYATDEGDRKELMLKKVDRERDTWVEAFKLFIEELRKEREFSHKNKQQRKNDRAEKAAHGLEQGSGSESAQSVSLSDSPGAPASGRSTKAPSSSGSGRGNCSSPYMSASERESDHH